MLLITSGAYLQEEFSTEVGLIPPSLLPIGNKRLYEYQIQFFKEKYKNLRESIYISLPESYKLSLFDKNNIEKLGVEIIYVPDHLTLASSILYSWNATAKNHQNLKILHGDTLFLNLDIKCKNTLSVHPNRGYHKRAKLKVKSENIQLAYNGWSNDKEMVVSGFFSFKKPLYFMKLLVESKSDFTEAINRYHEEFKLEFTESGEWLDFGHINNFYHARSQLTTQRAFNSLKIDKNTVSKSSEKQPLKIFAEGSWFFNMPLNLTLYTPALLELSKKDNISSYTIEYLYSLPLSDLMVFGNVSNGTWTSIFDSLENLLYKFSEYKPCKNEILNFINNDLYLSKTLTRLSDYYNQSLIDHSKQTFGLVDFQHSYTLEEIAIDSAKYITEANDSDISIVHGDLCFSNILFDSRSELVKCIDPRGLTIDNKLSIYGDKRYDHAKIYHSVIGKYDFIIANHYYLNIITHEYSEIFDLRIFTDDNFNHIEILYRETILKNSIYIEKEILAITIHLFLSMLPLHFDNPQRQKAFIANALRLYQVLKDKEL